MGNVVVTVVKYSALYVYSISIQPISKLYLFFFNQIVLLSLRKHHLHNRSILSQTSQSFTVNFEKSFFSSMRLFTVFFFVFLLLVFFCKREMHLIVLKQVLSPHLCLAVLLHTLLSRMFRFQHHHKCSSTTQFTITHYPCDDSQ